MVTDLEKDMPKVFAKIGRTDESVAAEKFINYVKAKGAVSYEDAYRFIHLSFPKFRDFETILNGALRAGLLRMDQVGNSFMLKAVNRDPKTP